VRIRGVINCVLGGFGNARQLLNKISLEYRTIAGRVMEYGTVVDSVVECRAVVGIILEYRTVVDSVVECRAFVGIIVEYRTVVGGVVKNGAVESGFGVQQDCCCEGCRL
jgi:hypothetical protein